MTRMIAAVVAFVLWTCCLPWTASAQTLPIRVGAGPTTGHVGVYVALEKGFFAKNGLDAKVNVFATGVEEINALVGGTQDVIVLGSTPFLSAVSNGLPLVMIGHAHGDAVRTSYNDDVAIVATQKSGITDIKSLRGKRVATPLGSGGEAYLMWMLSENGLSTSNLQMMNVKPSEMATALRNNNVDAISIWEPWASAAEVNVPGAVRVSSGGCKGCYDPGSILTTKAFVVEKAEALRRFMVAYAEAQQWVRQNMDAAAEIAAHYVPGEDVKTLKMAIRHGVYDSRISKNARDMYVEKAIPFLVSQKRISKTFDPGPNIDPQFYLYAQKTAPQFYSDLPPIPEAVRLK